MTPRITFDHVDLTYPVYGMAGRSLKLALMRQVVGSRVDLGVENVEINALSDISFEIKEGDRLGLIGRNGSGKSTSLRLIARLMFPTRGRVDIEGRVLPLLERGLGINPELTGAENIELPLRLLGATSEEIQRARVDVPEFTELGAFMHMPFRTYSDGMRARLLFGLCTAIEGDIIALDEWLSAGDIEFMERARLRLQGLLARTGIVVLASHSPELIRAICNKVAWMERGRLVAFGDTTEVLAAYTNAATHGPQAELSAEPAEAADRS